MWIFGYGSLMWNPDFIYIEKKEAILIGYKRNFCIKTHTHRGCVNNYGIVLGLEEDQLSSCKGILFKVTEENYKLIKEKLDKRELLEKSYTDKIIKIKTTTETINALTYISNNKSEFYIDVHCEKKAEIIKSAEGFSGKNIDYYLNTLDKLKDMGVEHEHIFNIKKYL
jgi:cation transport protein ChaC